MDAEYLKKQMEALVKGEHGSPADVLGKHGGAESGRCIIRTYQPGAEQVDLLTAEGDARPMTCVRPEGLFEWIGPDRHLDGYRFRIHESEGVEREVEDPYRFPFQLTDFDLHLHAEGSHYRAYQKMGARELTLDGVRGVHFAVWAPNAVRVSVIGEFNQWNGSHHPMQKRDGSGLWELFLPGLQQGALYKFEINGPGEFLQEKSDPFGFGSELRPQNASVVWRLDQYDWNDAEWMRTRRDRKWHEEPISVYEVHLSSWKRSGPGENDWLSYRELAEQLAEYCTRLGYTHVELLPISEHPFDGSWGYQTIGYYAPTSRFGTPDDFKYFVDTLHRVGIGVLIDWVPAHFPKDSHGLAYFDGTHLYEHADPRQGEHMDWGTLIFNYGRNEVRAFLLSNAVFWADVYHIDGLRVDAVASMLYLDYSRKEGEWIPNKYGGRENLEAVEFLKTFNEVIHQEYPGFLTFAEESTAWPMVSRPVYLGGLGFDFKWNMGWMHDTLEYIGKDPVHRKYHHGEITFSMLYAFTENFILPFSHDEVVHGKRAMLDKMPGDLWRKVANLRMLYAYQYAHPGKKLLFMGSEFGQWTEWYYGESLPWHLLEEESYHRQLQTLVADLNAWYREEPALYEIENDWQGFEWIDCHDTEQSTLAFLRKGRAKETIAICMFNFTPIPRHGYRVGVPYLGTYRERLNTDSGAYGGSNVINENILTAEPVAWQSQPYSVSLDLPPLGAVMLAPEALDIPEEEPAEPPAGSRAPETPDDFDETRRIEE